MVFNNNLAHEFLIIVAKDINLRNMRNLVENWPKVVILNKKDNIKYLPLLSDLILNNTGYQFKQYLIENKVVSSDIYFWLNWKLSTPYKKMNFCFENELIDSIRLGKKL